jgi:GTP cyclohydrolase I
MATLGAATQALESSMKKEFDTGLVENSISNLLDGIGEPFREGLQHTPIRVAKFYREFLSPEEFKFTTFENDGSDQMIVQSEIEFQSLCEHHLLPFYGTAIVAYIPGDKIVGISKLARCVDTYARRLQNQERITRQIADALQEALDPVGVAVVLKARHSCMEMRGIKKKGAITTTSCLYGAFKDEGPCRSEFLSLANSNPTRG